MKRTLWFVFVVLALLLVVLLVMVSGPALSVLAQAPALTVAQTGSGTVAAAWDSGREVSVFKMIPYAAPPVGDLRWKSPQPVIPWQGVRRGDAFSAMCMQAVTSAASSVYYYGHQAVSEDCLYLNVWTSAKTSTEKLPVIVAIPGGPNVGTAAANTRLAGSLPDTDGTALAKKGVVVVSFNYRLGMFGFLAHPDLTKESGSTKASGNYGLMDQIAALQWVQKNIAAFGGDPNKVTLYGAAAGSQDVCDLTASPLAKGLFQRAIGGSVSCWFYGVAPAQAMKLAAAEQAGVNWAKTNFNASTIAELRAVSAWEMVKFAGANARIVDGYVIRDFNDVTYAKGQQNDVTLLVGWNKDEGTAFPPMATTVANYTAVAQTRFGKSADQFLKVYPATTDAQALEQSYALYRDHYAWSQWEWAKAHNQTGKTKTYLYYWTYTPPWLPGVKTAEQDPATKLGAYNGSEINYIFGTLDLRASQRQYTDGDRKLSDLMSSYWVNFAKTGDPNGPGLPTWPAFDEKATNPVLYIGAQTQGGPVPNKAGLDFYEALYNALRPPQAAASVATTAAPPPPTAVPTAAAVSKAGGNQVLIFISLEPSLDAQYMLTQEVVVYKSLLEKADFKVVVATMTGQPIVGTATTLKPDLKLADVKIDDYAGVLLACFAAGAGPRPPEAVDFVKKVVAQGKPLAAMQGGTVVLAQAGVLQGKQFAAVAAVVPQVKGGIYKGVGVVQDGNIITAGNCPYIDRQYGTPEFSVELVQKFIALLMSKR